MFKPHENMSLNDWRNTGLLEGLNTANSLLVIDFFERVSYDTLANDRVMQCIYPVIRRIISRIIPGQNQISKLVTSDDWECLLVRIDVNDIITKLDVLLICVEPVLSKLLPNIDSQAELVALFCNDYAYSIIEKYKTETKYEIN